MILQRFYLTLKDARFSEKLEVQILVNLLKNSLTSPNQCISAVVGVFFCKALIILLHPDHYLYKSINKFLLHRPITPLDDIPMFFDLMYAASPDNQYQKRNWELDTLASSLHRYRDYKLYKRRRVLGILMGLYDGVSVDNHFRTSILQLLTKACGIKRIAVDLVESESLLSWLQMHVVSSPEEIFKILEILLKTLPDGFVLHMKNSSLIQILQVFVLYVTEATVIIPECFKCLELMVSTLDISSLISISDSLLMKLSDGIMEHEGIESYLLMFKMIVRFHKPPTIGFSELVTKKLLDRCYFFLFKLAHASICGGYDFLVLDEFRSKVEALSAQFPSISEFTSQKALEAWLNQSNL